MQARLTASVLGYAGLIPFYGFLLGFALLEDYPRSLSIQGFLLYSLAILSFLGGTVWGYARNQPLGEQTLRLVVSNGVVIFAVACLLTAQTTLAATLMLLGYLALLWYERNVDGTEGWYATLRWRLTAGVVLAHVFYAILHIMGA